jgi:hypothetical protein
MKTTITSIELSERDNSTDVVDIITLSDGRVLQAWNGNASYIAYDKAKGNIEVGAWLEKVEDDESYKGDAFKVYTFA